MGKKRGRPKKQTTITQLGMLPMLQKPTETIGATIQLPGDYWDWRSSRDAAAAKAQTFECTVCSFDAMHTWTESGKPPSAVFEVQDPDPAEDGSHATLWIPYPRPFLEHWYKTHPMPGAAADSSDDELDDSGGLGNDTSEQAAPEGSQNSHGVYAFLEFVRSEVVKTGKMAGLTAKIYKCTTKHEGVVCGVEVRIVNKMSRHVGDGCVKLQVKAGVPDHKILYTVDTCPTRWGNQFDQMETNVVLRPVLDPAISKFKADNHNNKQAIMVESEFGDDGNHRAGKEITAREVSSKS